MTGNVQVFDDPAALADAAARLAVNAVAAAVAAQGEATWVLAGGSTPMAAYRLLAGRLKGSIAWDRLRVLMGDERAVPLDDPDSNWGQTAKVLLDHVPVPDSGRLVPRGELGVDEMAADYERQVGELPKAASGWPRFDLLWLGTGEDGHTLSLFPGHPEIAITDRLVVPVTGSPKPPPERISLSLPVLRGTGCCTVMAAGEGKADVIARAVAGDERLPLARVVREVSEAGASVNWLLDRAAAAKL
jgi:6-phosphogluconolactonase